MKNIVFIFIIIISLEIKGGNFLLSQKEAILGEPVIIEFLNLKPFEFPMTIFLEGPNALCKDISEYQNGERINLVDLFKLEGEYEINLIDTPDICDDIKEVKILKEKLEVEEDERERGYLNMQLGYRERSLESTRQDLYKYASFKIKINYPIEFDKYIYENYFKGRENLEEFWGKGLYEADTREEILSILKEVESHPESNYFPWFIYISFNKNLNFGLGGEKEMFKELDKKYRGRIKGDKEFLKGFVKKMDLVIEKWKNFPFLDEVYLKRGIFGFFLGEDDKKLKEIFKNAKAKAKHKEIKEIAERFLKELNKN